MEKLEIILASGNPFDLPEGDLPEGFVNSTEGESQVPEDETQVPEDETQTPEDETQTPEDETQASEDGTQSSEGETEVSEDETEVLGTETEVHTETKEPFVFLKEVGNKLKESPILCGALGVVLTLLLIVIWDMIRKNKQVKVDQKESEIVEEHLQNEKIVHTSQEPQEVNSSIQADKVCGIGQRDDQQDAYGLTDDKDILLYHRRGQFAVVADGMGGLSNGGEISSLAVKSCYNLFYELPEYKKPSDMLLEMAKAANYNVNMYLRNRQRSGSTLAASIIRDGYLYFLTIGDSHIYLYRNGGMFLLNREHVYREELALSAINGEVAMEQVKGDKQSKSLTSYLGVGEISHMDRNEDGIKLLAGDKILLCSDGVYGTISESQMEAALRQDVHSAVHQIQQMIENEDKPYQDNYTAVVLEYLG